VGPFTLRTILAFLLIFTVLTVAIAQAEQWAMGYFGITLPHWVNLVGAMAIAVVKSVLVMAYFMQLRYDNLMNTIVMLFTFFAVGLFIFFSGLDLFTRDRVTSWKAEYVNAGGNGVGVVQASNGAIVKAARDRAIEKWGPDLFAKREAEAHAHGHHAHHEPAGSTPSRSRPLKGLTGADSTTHDVHAPAGAAHAAPNAHAPAGGH
jgi:caa(3)-type oxidase subunit IV